MAAYSALTALALTILPPGRASVLAFSTPIWVVPLAAWWLHEHASRRALFGVGLGLVGVLTIAAPSVHPKGAEEILAYVMLLGAAAAWAISIVAVRCASLHGNRPRAGSVANACCRVPAPSLGDRCRGRAAADWNSWCGIACYVGPIATAFAYWAVVETGRHIRASTMSMALLATPGLGILISALTLGEGSDHR